MRRWIGFLTLTVTLALAGSVFAQTGFVNWESPHVSPMDMTPDGTMLLTVNTADDRIEVFDLTAFGPVLRGSVPVGLDPVSVRARTNTEAWVVNHISDSISIVDLTTMNVVATILTGDEPCDVVFAGAPEKAFVSVSQLNQVRVFDPSDLTIAPIILAIEGEDPRALATDGTNVYAAIFESGNKTTIIEQSVVSSPVNPYQDDRNPPPNSLNTFVPAFNIALPTAPQVSLIVKKSSSGQWLDDHQPTPGDWSAAVPWDLHDHDVAVIDANSLTVSYVTGLMNLNMALAVAPAGDVFVVGTDAINNIRFEANVNGIFVRVMGAKFAPAARGGGDLIADLNPHLDYSAPSVAQNVRDQSVGDPRGIDFSPSRNRAYITGMGSNTVIAVDASFNRLGQATVGAGPTGLKVDETRGVAYVLNKFEASVDVLDLDDLSELGHVPFHDATPLPIKLGRPHFYNTHKTSGLGQASCGSCHVDGRLDQLAWDLGDPSGTLKPFNQTCGIPGACEDWHPMKGPMTTQTLIGIIGTEPLHWRADRENLAAFNGAFVSLMGDVPLTGLEMNQFTNFIASLTYPPNPNRNLDNTLKTALFNGGNPEIGFSLYMTGGLDGVECNDCHSIPTGTNGQLTPGPLLLETQSVKVPQLRNLYEKTGFDKTSLNNNRGYGYIHDGSTDSIFNFLFFPGFQFPVGPVGDQQRRDVESFLLSFSIDTHAGVGAQATLGGAGPDQTARRNQLLAIADSGQVGLVAKGVVGGVPRGWFYLGANSFQSDLAAETATLAQLDAEVSGGAKITYTLVPLGTEQRIGVDRDADGFFDRDEFFLCSDPADPASIPGSDFCPSDITGDDFNVNVVDLLMLLGQWGQNRTAGDVNCDGDVNVVDLIELLGAWGPCL